MKTELTWTAWMKKVDEHIAVRCGGLTSADLDDWRYRDDFEDGLTPGTSANKAINNAGGLRACRQH